MQLLTKANRIEYFVALSCLQKEIRRGNEQEAYWWALEIEDGYTASLWRRLRIISVEDVGLGNPDAARIIETLERFYWIEQQLEEKKHSERVFLAQAILLLCRSAKSRGADDLMAFIGHRKFSEGWKPEIPDYALDAHTAQGKAMGRGLEHWTTEGCVVFPEITGWGANHYKELAFKARKQYGRLPGKPIGWKKPVPKKISQKDIFDLSLLAQQELPME